MVTNYLKLILLLVRIYANVKKLPVVGGFF